MQNKKNKVSLAAGGLAVAMLLAGSFAYFTDKTEQNATATAGNIDLVFTDQSLKTESTGDKVQARDNVWTDGKLVVDNGVLNPGDVIDMDYQLSNTGSKSIDVRQRLILTSSVPLTDKAEEYTLAITGGKDQTAVTPVVSDDKKTLTYNLADIVLNGTIENDDATNAAEGYEVAMKFDKAAKNAFMNSTVSVKLEAQAKQHRNTIDTDFSDWAQIANVEKVN